MSASEFVLRSEEYRPHASKHKDIGIGIVGCGDVVRAGHLPAYRNCGYKVVVACDIDEEPLELVRRDFGVEKVTNDLDIVLNDPGVRVVDLAVHAHQRRPLIERIVAAGKHVFSQKPFAMTLDEAREMVEICERGGVKLMINQQARWVPAYRAIKVMLDRGVCGHVYSILHFCRTFQDKPGAWCIRLKNFHIVDNGIHFIDLSRHLSGMTPQRVYCATTTMPGQLAVTPMIYDLTLEYEQSAQCMAGLHFNALVSASATLRREWCIDGTEGSLIGSERELVFCPKNNPSARHVTQIEGQWLPDAFGGSMGEMLDAIADDREPLTNGRDNLNSLAIALAAVRSSETHEPVSLAEL